ncbi:MAG TPA: hypothetical protein PKV98_17335 [Burkholderiaceae bacterium]|nr:hypothetical protein [Burkholderiaceae bacterium]
MKLTGDQKRDMRKLAFRVACFLQRRIYDHAVAALADRGGRSEDAADDVRLCIDAAARAVELTDESELEA